MTHLKKNLTLIVNYKLIIHVNKIIMKSQKAQMNHVQQIVIALAQELVPNNMNVKLPKKKKAQHLEIYLASY